MNDLLYIGLNVLKFTRRGNFTCNMSSQIIPWMSRSVSTTPPQMPVAYVVAVGSSRHLVGAKILILPGELRPPWRGVEPRFRAHPL